VPGQLYVTEVGVFPVLLAGMPPVEPKEIGAAFKKG